MRVVIQQPFTDSHTTPGTTCYKIPVNKTTGTVYTLQLFLWNWKTVHQNDIGTLTCQSNCLSVPLFLRKNPVNSPPIWSSENKKSLKLVISIATMIGVANGQGKEEFVETGPGLLNFLSSWQKLNSRFHQLYTITQHEKNSHEQIIPARDNLT